MDTSVIGAAAAVIVIALREGDLCITWSYALLEDKSVEDLRNHLEKEVESYVAGFHVPRA